MSSETDEAGWQAGAAGHQRLRYQRAPRTDEAVDYAYANLSIDTNIHPYIYHAWRRRSEDDDDDHARLNRRFLIGFPMGVINRELYEAPGIRRTHIAPKSDNRP